MEDEHERRLAGEILDEFEELLDSKDISIPSEDREGGDGEARLFGTEYFELEDRIVGLLRKGKSGEEVMSESQPQSRR